MGTRMDEFHADAETLRLRHILASCVRNELAIAGLPIAAEKLSYYYAIGAEVEVEDGKNAPPGGVWVHWHPHPHLSEKAVDLVAVHHHQAAHDPIVKHAGAVSKAMVDAIFAILVSAGYEVVHSDDGLKPFAVRVIAPPATAWWPPREEA